MATKRDIRRFKLKMVIRKKINGTSEKPRLSVFKSNKEIYVQIIDDVKKITLVSASSIEKTFVKNGNKTDVAVSVGKLIAERAKCIGVDTVVFDRNGYLYHGRIKSLADAVRDGGLKF
ncbi:MAG: 50S ribosomal protein L18 [Bacteroidales bacterium]|jgi:large subunit ribosomal protein L18|nr:50S ribosomal protein L18 [Bacteroidales bacterium]